MRIRAVVVAIQEGHLLVMHRRKDGRTYSVLPGGGIEPGETPQEACLRELAEETGLDGTVEALLPVPLGPESPALYFAVRTAFDHPILGGPEAERSSGANTYEPAWVPLGRFEELGLVPHGAREAVGIAVARHDGAPCGGS